MNTRSSTKSKLALATLSGVMLGFSFPPFETGMLAAAAFVPFFILFDYIDDYREALLYSYITFFVFNAITVYWTGGFTHGQDLYLMLAGAMLLIAHPMFFCVPVLLWVAFRRQFGFKTALLVFPFMWISFELAHAHGQVAFPWLVLGNTQTYDLAVVQFASFTGVYGISFWLLSLNVVLFTVYAKLAANVWRVNSVQTIIALVSILLLYLVPKIYGNNILRAQYEPPARTIRVGIVQPNIDPFAKWDQKPDSQVSLLQNLTTDLAREKVDLVVWPETAVPFYLLLPSNRMYVDQIKRQVDTLGIHVLTGVPDLIEYTKEDVIPKSSKTTKSGLHYDTFNSSILFSPGNNVIQKYAKMQLVPFAERVPFSEELSFLNAMQWNFGLGGWNFGKEATVFRFTSVGGQDATFSNLICYESVFPGFVADFVKHGAQFLTVITNDSWWGNTSGAYQHKQIAVLRAVENRRWVVQCANGGISCFIDPFGHILHPTTMYTQATLSWNIEPRTDLTFYSQHGDWLAELCVMLSVFFLTAALGKKIYMNIRSRQANEIY